MSKIKWFFQSRKVLISIATILTEAGNHFFGWNISQEVMNNIVTIAASLIFGIAIEDSLKGLLNSILHRNTPSNN